MFSSSYGLLLGIDLPFFCNFFFILDILTDYVSILKIVDESAMHEELSVHIFSDRIEDLPRVQSYRDFIILYRVMVFVYFLP